MTEEKKERRRKAGGHALLMDPTLQDRYWGETLPRNKFNLANRQRTRDQKITAAFYSQMLCQLSYGQLAFSNFKESLSLEKILKGWENNDLQAKDKS